MKSILKKLLQKSEMDAKTRIGRSDLLDYEKEFRFYCLLILRRMAKGVGYPVFVCAVWMKTWTNWYNIFNTIVSI